MAKRTHYSPTPKPQYTPSPVGNPLGPAFPAYRPPPPAKQPEPGNPVIPTPNYTGDRPYRPRRGRS